MEGYIFAIALVISAIAMIWMYVGPWAVVLLIVVTIFGIYKLLHFGDNEEECSEYVEKALEFIRFSQQISSPIFTLFATPQCIGTVLSDEDLGLCIQSYLSTTPNAEYERVKRDILFEKIAERTGGNDGLQRYRELGLSIDLWKHNEDHPAIIRYLYPPYSKARGKHEQLDTYVKALKRRYNKQYQSELKISVWGDYKE